MMKVIKRMFRAMRKEHGTAIVITVCNTASTVNEASAAT